MNYLELIGGTVALTLIMVYAVFKILQNKKFIEFRDKQTPEALTVEKVEDKRLEVKEEIKPLEEVSITKTIDRKKRKLLPHGKISKDDFAVFKNVKILIAEDNIINQKVITSLLSDSGINITIANDGQEALDILEKDINFSVILMDAHMPIIDGFEATKIIRKNPKYDHIPIVALSGDTASDDIRNMLNAGMEGHLEKPLKMDNLYDILYIYTSGDEVKNNSMESHITAEFNSNKGLEICGDDKSFYLEILNDFISKYSDSADRLKDLINSGDSIGADKMLLDISGVTANIGADNLHQIAIDLKDSIAHPADMEYINNLKKYKRSLTQVCEAIKEHQAKS